MPKRAFATPMSRRSFLRNFSITAAGGLLAACAVGEEGAVPVDRLESAFTDVTLPMPRSVAAVAAQPADAELEGFLALSALLTGVEQLDPVLGNVYLHSLQASSAFDVTVSELLEQARGGLSAIPASLEEIESSGIFENEATRKLADKITEYWYTGIYDTPQGEQVVATYVDALAWRTLVFTKPTTLCGSYRFWTEPPETAID
ncbi:MAG: hypothetical protein IT328_07100 [Caldilineaceae bacterium]|nr:hypothetical protein [Caldilineaceae bacterium]